MAANLPSINMLTFAILNLNSSFRFFSRSRILFESFSFSDIVRVGPRLIMSQLTVLIQTRFTRGEIRSCLLHHA